MLSGSEVACFSILSNPPQPPLHPRCSFDELAAFWLTETFVTGCFRLAHTTVCSYTPCSSSSSFLSFSPFVLIILTLLTDLNFIFLCYCQTERKWSGLETTPMSSSFSEQKAKYKNNDSHCCAAACIGLFSKCFQTADRKTNENPFHVIVLGLNLLFFLYYSF